ncbi:MAG: radical SAM protein [Clostridiales bacterium]|nr:radical SAM protein [Clostridiales bacterium]
MKIRELDNEFLIGLKDKYLLTNEMGMRIISLLDETRSVELTIERVKSIANIDYETAKKWVEMSNKWIYHFPEISDIPLDLRLPMKVQWRMTQNCNLFCKHCYNMNSGKKTIDTHNHIMGIVNKLIEADIMEVTLTGGEILTIPFIDEVFQKLLDNDVYINIYTNAILLDEHIDILSMNKEQFKIFTSIDGVKEDHDRIRGIGSYDKTMKNIELAISKGCDIQTNTVINAINYKEIPRVVSILTSVGVKSLQFSYTVIEGNAKVNNDELQMTRDMYDEISNIMKNINEKSKDDVKVFFENYHLNEQDNSNVIDDFDKPWRCTAGETRFTIIENGDVIACPYFPEFKLGNIGQNSIEEIWNSELKSKFVDFRDKNSSGNKCAALVRGKVVTNII